MNKTKNNASKRSIVGSVFEELSDLGKQTVKTAGSQFGTMAQDGARSIVGLPLSSNQSANESTYDRGLDTNLSLPERMGYPSLAQKKEKPRNIELFSFAERRETLEVNEQIKKLVVFIKEEIRRIEETNQMMITQTAKITVEQLSDKPGVYHVRFFEWLLNLLRDVRKKVSESANWLSIAHGKQKKGFWATAKKKGTSFTLSGERTASTQSG
jgi:hypothetical protein